MSKSVLPLWAEIVVLLATISGIVGLVYGVFGYYKIERYLRWDLVIMIGIAIIVAFSSVKRIRALLKAKRDGGGKRMT